MIYYIIIVMVSAPFVISQHHLCKLARELKEKDIAHCNAYYKHYYKYEL